jgi:nucleoid-associated protein YgaU
VTASIVIGLSIFGQVTAGDAADTASAAAPRLQSVPAQAISSDSTRAAEIDRLRAENAELRQRLQQQSAISAELEQAQAENAELKTELSARDLQRQSTAREHTAQLNAAELRLREHKDRLLGLQRRIQELETTVAERDAEIDALQARLDARGSAEARLNERLEALRARLPAPEGGSLTAAEARKQAQTDAERLAELIRQGRGLNNPQLWRQVREAENALHHSQFLLARSDNARTVYRVRPGDTLPQVSLMFYGDEDHWARLFDANRHLVDDPNRLLPGLTLVVP